ncbi:MAG: hypothetical protein AAGA96_10530 [Verrucomicrobiota bacterium]
MKDLELGKLGSLLRGAILVFFLISSPLSLFGLQNFIVDDFLVDSTVRYILDPQAPSGGFHPVPNTLNSFHTGDQSVNFTQSSSSAIGGTRDLTLGRSSPSPNSQFGTSDFVFYDVPTIDKAGVLAGAVVNTPARFSFVEIEISYDSAGAGLGGLDFSSFDRLELNLTSDSLGVGVTPTVFVFSLEDTFGNESVESVVVSDLVPANLHSSISVMLSDFVADGVDASSIDRIGFSLFHPGTPDFTLASFEFVIPEPSQILYLGSFLLLVGSFRRRRRG